MFTGRDSCWSNGRIPASRILPGVFYSFLVATFFVFGCSSSEETGAAQRADQPAIEVRPSQPSDLFVPDTALSSKPATVPARKPSGRVRPSVRRGQDTVRAATSKSVRSNAQRSPLVKPPNAMYTVQVGSFRSATNALELLKKVKKLHPQRPVFNNYSTSEKLYRISVGKFETLQEAWKYRKTMMAEHPQLYTSCWVTYIQR